GGVEAEADRAAGGDRGVPGGVGGGDVGSGGAELGVPALAEPLPGGEGPPQGPAVDGAAEVGDGDVAGEAGVPLVDGVVDAASGGGLDGAAEGRGAGGAQRERGERREGACRSAPAGVGGSVHGNSWWGSGTGGNPRRGSLPNDFVHRE